MKNKAAFLGAALLFVLSYISMSYYKIKLFTVEYIVFMKNEF